MWMIICNIRPNIYELFENEKRVLVIEVPSRPAGKVFKFLGT